MKEELYVFTKDGRVRLDLPSPSGITLKWVSNLFSDLSKLTCSHSYTFQLPMTINNRVALSMADDIRGGDNAFYRKYIKAEFFVDGFCLCPNAKLYLVEVKGTFSCAMTWKVLSSFEKLKSSNTNLNDLPSMGSIEWNGGEPYGVNDGTLSNNAEIIYPDYDAGTPHGRNTPPLPCVPLYKIIKTINEEFGTTFRLGEEVLAGFGTSHMQDMNEQRNGRRVYDDYITNGALPLTNIQADQKDYTTGAIETNGFYSPINSVRQTAYNWWYYIVYGDNGGKRPGGGSSFGGGAEILDGGDESLVGGEWEWEQFLSKISEQSYDVNKSASALSIPILSRFASSKYVMPLYGYQHSTENGTTGFMIRQGATTKTPQQLGNGQRDSSMVRVRERMGMDYKTNSSFGSWGEDLHLTIPFIGSEQNFIYPATIETGRAIGVMGFYATTNVTVRGTAKVRISNACFQRGLFKANDFVWISVAKVCVGENNETYESVTEKNASSALGFRSIDLPKYDAATKTYVAEFDFGGELVARSVGIDNVEAEDGDGYRGLVFLPYHTSDFSHKEKDSNNKEQTVRTLFDGEISFENFRLDNIIPDVKDATLPMKIDIASCLPKVSCFNFLKSLFYMNGAMPRVESDGETITAMYYNQLRDRIEDNQTIDWSSKLIEQWSDGMSEDTKFHNTTFAQNNYLEMSKSYRNVEEEDRESELDVYSDGYGTIEVADETLKEEASIFKTVFYPPYIANIRYPALLVGNTIKLWEGDGELCKSVQPVYGIINQRRLDNGFENTNITRPNMPDREAENMRLNVFSPFENDKQRSSLFGYLQQILDNYVLIKEKMLLNEYDLINFDESMPVYLSKYNAYFAVSTIQRSKDGQCTVELVKLPILDAKATEEEPADESIVPVEPEEITVDRKIDGTVEDGGLVYVISDVQSFIKVGINTEQDAAIVYAKTSRNDEIETASKSIELPMDGVVPIAIGVIPTSRKLPQGDYVLDISFSTTMFCNVRTTLDGAELSKKAIAITTKVFVDDKEVTDTQHIGMTFFGQQQHVIKFEGDIVVDGKVIKNIHSKVYCFASDIRYDKITDKY